MPVIAGGVEASLRRLAHYDYWSDTVRRAIMLDAKADLVVFGMGEHQIVTIARRLAAGETVKDLRDMRGVAYALGASESQTIPQGCDRLAVVRGGEGRQAAVRSGDQDHPPGNQPAQCPHARPVSRSAGHRLQPTAVAGQPGRHGQDLRAALHPRCRTRCTRGERFLRTRSSRIP